LSERGGLGADTFDVVILGGGSGGYSCALRSAQLGMSVALVEQDKLGGTCLHRGCIPTKALLHAAEVADSAREARAVGIDAQFIGVDMAAFATFKSGVVDRLYQGLQGLIRSGGITLVTGTGRLAGGTAVQVGDKIFRGRNLVLATGSKPRSLPGVEIGGRVVTSTEALDLMHVPDSVVVIGGSVIGVEFASTWRSLGAAVTLVEALPGLVPLEDPSLGKKLERAFRKRGIAVQTNARVRKVSQTEHRAEVALEDGTVLDADLVLVAVGRGPNSAGLGLESHGVQTDREWVVTDDRLRTSVPNLWAVGDLVPGLQLAHRGFAHGMFVAEEIAGLRPALVADAQIPRVTYCEPEVASVGLTEPQARDLHGDGVEVTEYNLAGNGKSQILGTAGGVKLVAVKGGPIVGVHMIGARMGEQIGEAALLVNWEATAEDTGMYVHAHPTQNEALGEAALALAGRPLHTHG
jgi:dihydrolipoamide dehydrogenase